ncbi:hypothetical protein SAMN02745857_02618 [Andreprevotia lacus DSM 23236]|jgi:hypothetical protein|uniref:Uncharacterized protein n=1 Tax=Andreprevotia lacus DSM 23236 TaxID=1121001 RepID=A0A1W1XSI3_9NEIS|nr:hypothetical protein [Andreprevotia lacus]SMC26856.1 hypothetical protein SAMN02745857_02618 [Andreprevotia lacus DSM 23236]
MLAWLKSKLAGHYGDTPPAGPATAFPQTELMARPAPRADEDRHHPLRRSVVYRLKRDALLIVAEMNRGTKMEDCDLLARQLAFVQKELIQAAYHDEHIPKEDRIALAKYHALNIRHGLGERRTQPLRGVEVPPVRKPAKAAA